MEALRMTASSRINSHTDLNRIDATRGNITVEECDLLVNEKNVDRQTHAHHIHKQCLHTMDRGVYMSQAWSSQSESAR